MYTKSMPKWATEIDKQSDKLDGLHGSIFTW
jgi:hypothetical protein